MTTEERLESLEREVARARRRNRWVLAVVGLGTLAWTVIGAARASDPSLGLLPGVPKVIRAKEFLVEEGNGKTRARLFVGQEGPVLVLFDANGTPRAELCVLKSGPGLRLSDENGKTRAMLGRGTIVAQDGRTTIYPESSLLLIGPEGIWQAP